MFPRRPKECMTQTPGPNRAAPAAPSQASSAATGKWVLAASILASSMAFIDGTAVNVALPALQNALHATVGDVQWVVESYALLLASLLLVGGSLGDRFGRRRLFLMGVILFAVASAWCGIAGSATTLIFARGVQGVGAALLLPGSLSLITASFTEEDRGAAIGTWSGLTTMTAAIGPVFGGLLVEHASWRWVFFLNVPIALAAALITIFRVPESRNEKASEHVDYPGAALATIGLGGTTFALIEGPKGPAHAVTAAILGFVCLIAFLIVEHRSKHPMLCLAIFKSRAFTGSNLITLFLYSALGGILFFFPLDLIQVQHYTATEAGAALLPLILIIFALSTWSGRLVVKYGAKWPLTIGPLIVAIGLAGYTIPGNTGSYWTTFFPAVVLLGLGMAISVAPLTTTVMNSVPENEAGVASGVNNAVSRLASLLSVAVFGLVLYLGFSHALDHKLAALHLAPAVRAQVEANRTSLAAVSYPDAKLQGVIYDAFLVGYREILWLASALAAVAALCGFFLLDSTPQKAVKGAAAAG